MKDHKELQAFEKQNRKILQTRGELSTERKEKLEALQLSHERLLSSVQSFAEALDETVPDLPIDEESRSEAEEMKLAEGDESSSLEDIWGDEETRRFYEVLPDLSVFLPGSYVKDVPKQETAPVNEETLDEELTLDEIEEIEKADEPEQPEVEEPQVQNSKIKKIK